MSVTQADSRNSLRFLILILFAAAAFRITLLDVVPPGVNQDEAMHAWDAWCLLKTGMDHGGARWPVFCESFGLRESHAAPFVYLLIPFQSLLGMNIWSTRLPSAMAGTLAVALVYFFVARFGNRRTALLAATMLAISPWHVHLSRLAFEASIGPTMLLAGLVLVCRSGLLDFDDEPKRAKASRLLASGIVFGLLTWTYNAYRVFVPVFLVGTTMVLWRFLKARLSFVEIARVAAIGSVGFLLGVSPFVAASFLSPEKAWGRATSEFVLTKSPSFAAGFATMAKTYALQLSPSFLFWEGDPSLVQSVPGHGQLYYVVGVFVLTGLALVVRHWRSQPLGRLVVVWILLAPIPAGMTMLASGHALRASTVIPAYEILAGIGLCGILEWSARWSASGRVVMRSILVVALTVSAGRFAYVFFVDYPKIAGPSFWEEYRPLFADVAARQKDYDLILLSPNECPQNGTLYLFYTGADPHRYFEAPKRFWHGKDWDSLVQYGNVYFAYYRNLPTIVRESFADRKELRVLVAERSDVAVQGELLRTFRYSDGRDAMKLYEVRVTLGPS